MGTVYATTADLENGGLPPLALQGLSEEQKTSALTDAASVVDSYLSTRFDMPLASFGRDIVRATVAIASLDLLARRGFQPGAVDAEVAKTRYDEALRWLRDVAGGRATPAHADTTSKDSFDPQDQPFTRQMVSGGISISDSDEESTTFGTLRAPRSRGW